MKKFIKKHSITLGIGFFLLMWRIFLFVIEQSRYIIPTRLTYFGIIPQANFDGIYYLSISQYGYKGLDQAFFPLFPIAINLVGRITNLQPAASALMVSALSLFVSLYVLSKLIKKDLRYGNYMWAIIFFLSFPTSFFFGAIYTESLFLALTLLSFYFARKGLFFIASLFGMFASATRVIGVFLLPALVFEMYEQQRKKKKINLLQYLVLCLIPVGLLSYMGFLWSKYGDPLLFVHIQSAFGAGRSNGTIILLPQVIYRYFKIFITVSTANLTFWISCLELSTLILGVLILYLAWRRGIRKSYVLFSACALLFPTLSGTLSSLPRYALASFAVFIYLGMIKSKFIKVALIIMGLSLEGILAILFFQGYFIS